MAIMLIWNKQLVKVGMIPLPPYPQVRFIIVAIAAQQFREAAESSSQLSHGHVQWNTEPHSPQAAPTCSCFMGLVHWKACKKPQPLNVELSCYFSFIQFWECCNMGMGEIGYGIRQILRLAALQILMQ